MRNIELSIAVLLATAGTVHAQPSKITVEQLSTASKPGTLIDDGLALRSDCQPAQNCQAGQLTTAYNTTQFVTAEDFVPAEDGFITTACIQGIFWNGTNTPDNAAGDCSGFGSEEWTLTYYKDTVGDSVPDTVIGSVPFCTSPPCLPNNNPNFVSASKDTPTGNPDFAGIPLVRISVTHTPLGDDGFGGVTPLNAGECYYIEWQVVNSDTTSGVFGCSFYHQAGLPGNGRAMQDADFDGYDCCEILTEDLTLCIDLALDNSAVLNCDSCINVTVPPSGRCSQALQIGDGSNLAIDTSLDDTRQSDVPNVPGLEGHDLSSGQAEWTKLTGTGTRFQIDFDSSVMDTILAAYCGACDEHYYGITGNDDRAPGDTNSTILLDTEPGRVYYIFCTSRYKCGQGTLIVTDLGVPSVTPPETCGTCTLSAFSGLPIGVDEAAFEACDDTGSTRLNDGCNTNGLPSDFMPITPGQRISGSSWQLSGTRDTDWFVFTLAEPARVRWTAEAQFNFNVSLIDIGGDINTPDCADLNILVNSGALRCNTASVDAVLGPGDYVAWIGSQEFDFGACSTTPSGYGPDTAYDAMLDVAPILAPCSLADLTTQGAGIGDLRHGLPDQLVTGADISYYVNAWIAGDLAIADVTTTGAGVGDPGHGVPDGQITAADINYFVNIWIAGCP